MDNLEPFFKQIFGQQWETLPEIMQSRYANRTDSNDVVTFEGKLDIYYSKLMNIAMPIFRLFKVFAPYQGTAVPVIAKFQSKPNSPYIHFERTFYYPGKKPFTFSTYFQISKDNNVIEFTKLGLGWRMRCCCDGEKVVLQHIGFVGKLFGKIIPLPLGFFMGNIYAEEHAVSNDSFRMLMKVTHPLFGKMFEYGGVLQLVN